MLGGAALGVAAFGDLLDDLGDWVTSGRKRRLKSCGVTGGAR
jgi:hypothetical protein